VILPDGPGLKTRTFVLIAAVAVGALLSGCDRTARRGFTDVRPTVEERTATACGGTAARAIVDHPPAV